MRVTAALIVRDEELFLADCLASLVGQVDEIVIVDTGSHDNTLAIAAAYGGRVSTIPWPYDFAAARNAAIERSTGDWILWVDADDRLAFPKDFRIAELVDSSNAAGATVDMQWFAGSTVCREVRLFRNDPRIRFKGVIYESVLEGLAAVCRVEGLRIQHTSVRINHIGYEGDLTAKHQRNLLLLRRAIEQEPGHVFYWSRLGEALAALGRRDEAIEACQRSIELSRASGGGVATSAASLAYQHLANLLASKGEDALPIIEEGLSVAPDNYVLRFGHAQALIEAGQFEAACEILVRFIQTDIDVFRPDAIGYDVRMFREFAHDQLGVALMRLSRFSDAAACFEAASEAAPADLSYKVKAAAMRGRAARTGEHLGPTTDRCTSARSPSARSPDLSPESGVALPPGSRVVSRSLRLPGA